MADTRQPKEVDLAQVVNSLCQTTHGMSRAMGKLECMNALPSRDELITMVEELRSVLFPGYFGTSEVTAENMPFYVGAALDKVLRTLQEQVKRGYCFDCDRDAPNPDCENRALRTTKTFMARLPEVRRLLSTDVQAAYEGDPAATSPDEAIFCYPGLVAITTFRLAHELHKLEVPLLPRIITEHAHSITGVDIHPGATIKEKFFIDHATGVVIGETTEIGRNVRIYQGVTLGAKSFPLDEDGKPIKGIPRHPIVEDDVIIYGGATILGRVTIGKGSVVGGNVWLTRSIPPGSRITQARPHEESFESGAGI